METEPNKGYGVRFTDGNNRYLWWKIFTSKKYANNYLLRGFSKTSGILISPDITNCDMRATELRRIKKKHGLKVVKVKMIEVD